MCWPYIISSLGKTKLNPYIFLFFSELYLGIIVHQLRHRLMEAIITKLFYMYPSPAKKGQSMTTQMVQVATHYMKARGIIVENERVMKGTTIQLREINQATLRRW